MTGSTPPPGTEPRGERGGKGNRQRIVLQEPEYVPLSEADRRQAVKALADLLAAWWATHRDDPPRDDEATGTTS